MVSDPHEPGGELFTVLILVQVIDRLEPCPLKNIVCICLFAPQEVLQVTVEWSSVSFIEHIESAGIAIQIHADQLGIRYFICSVWVHVFRFH